MPRSFLNIHVYQADGKIYTAGWLPKSKIHATLKALEKSGILKQPVFYLAYDHLPEVWKNVVGVGRKGGIGYSAAFTRGS